MSKLIFKAFTIIRKAQIVCTKKQNELDQKLEKIIKLLEEKESHEK